MSIVGVVQARFESSRLPGKVMQTIGESTMIERVLGRLSRSSRLDRIIVATTDQPSDDVIAAMVDKAGYSVFRGSQYDVLDRYVTAVADFNDVDIVVRVTADCPFVDAGVVDEIIGFRETNGLDFAANRLPPPYKRTYPVGLDVEVATIAALRDAARLATSQHHREHVMPFLYESGNRYRFDVAQLEEDLSAYRWTVDTPEDLQAVRALDSMVGPEPFGWTDVLAIARAHPEIGAINSDQLQKDVTVVDSRWKREDGLH